MIRVLVCDDHDLLRESLVALLGAEHDLTVVGQCIDGDQVVDVARRSRPDIVLLDLAMARVGGLAAAARLTAELPWVRVVILTAHLDADAVLEARRLRLAGYLLKGDSPRDLAGHLRAVAAGGSAWAPATAAVLPETL